MFMASTKALGDIGSPKDCNEIEGARYWSFDINLNILPVNLILGTCLPASCSKQMLNDVSSKLNSLIYKSIQAINIPYFIKYNFTLDLFFENTESY